MAVDLSIMVGGEAGQGVQSMGAILCKAFARGGYSVFADQDYESRVRGGHNFFRIRVSDRPVAAISEPVDILVALNAETIELHRMETSRQGVVVYDADELQGITADDRFFAAPLAKLAQDRAGSKLMVNAVAAGVTLGLLGYGLDILPAVLKDQFGPKLAEGNVSAATAGYEHAGRYLGQFRQRLGKTGKPGLMLLNGNDALAVGAIAAGCTFISAYPMTPTTSIMEYMAARSEELGLVVLQAEDEIAAANMVIGASYAGARAMTATSGGGFCLMVEALSLAGMTETPMVVVLGQRPGPAIGLPTRTEQGELHFALHSGHGEFPRAVLAPANIEDCFWLAVKAFNLADKYQLPVIVLTDHHLASSYVTADRFDLGRVKIERGLVSNEELRLLKPYKRHQVTESGISPRALPLQDKVLVVTDSDEHNEEGHIIEDGPTRNEQMRKRLRKLEAMRPEMGQPRLEGAPGAEWTLIGWGSTYGAIKEAAALLEKDGVAAGVLHLNELWPFPAQAVTKALSNGTRSVVIENNATGQLRSLIRAETGIATDHALLKFDGRPFTPRYIADELLKEMK